MKIRSVLVISLMFACLYGCTQIDYKSNLQQASICCSQLSEIQYLPLVYNEPLTVRVGEDKSPARYFDKNKSFFLAVQLPKFEGPYEVQIQSIPINKQLFLPNSLILDDNYRIIEKIPNSVFDISNGNGSYKFFVNRNEGFRYLVLYATDIGKESEMRTIGITTVPIVAGPVVFNYSTGTDTKSKIKTAEGGELTVRVIKYQPKNVEP